MIEKEPKEELEKELSDVVKNAVTEVKVRNRTFKVSYLRHKTLRKMTEVMLADGDESQISCKCAALIVLNGMFRITFFYWFLWRWFYYVKQYYDAELIPLITEGKKKVPADEYYLSTILLIEMRDTMMSMTREEARHIRQELFSERHTQSAKTTDT